MLLMVRLFHLTFARSSFSHAYAGGVESSARGSLIQCIMKKAMTVANTENWIRGGLGPLVQSEPLDKSETRFQFNRDLHRVGSVHVRGLTSVTFEVLGWLVAFRANSIQRGCTNAYAWTERSSTEKWIKFRLVQRCHCVQTECPKRWKWNFKVRYASLVRISRLCLVHIWNDLRWCSCRVYVQCVAAHVRGCNPVNFKCIVWIRNLKYLHLLPKREICDHSNAI